MRAAEHPLGPEFAVATRVEMAIELKPVTAVYLGDQRAEVISPPRRFVVDQRANVGREGARFCPIELIAAAYAS